MPQESWEEFLAGPRKRNDAPAVRISLTRKGEIRLNATALGLLGEPESVVLLFDRVNSRIGIRPGSGESHSFPLRRSAHYRAGAGIERSRSRSALVYAAPFCDAYNIRPEKTLAFPMPTLRPNGILTLELSEAK